MRHRRLSRRFSRCGSHRKAMFLNLCKSLILHGKLVTTLIRAKDLRRLFEPMLTRAKVDSVHNRRYLFALLRDNSLVRKLIEEIAVASADRPGGYIRIIRCGCRKGDGAPRALVSLVDKPKKTDIEKASKE